MSFFDDLFGGGSNSKGTVVQNNTQSWPDWYQTAMKGFLNNANTIASNPYTPNPNQQVAPLTADQNAAYGTVRNMQGAYQPTVTYGTGLAAKSGQGFDQGAFEQYMNPYQNQVVNQIGQLAGRNLQENLLPAVNDKFISGGQFGSRGNIDLTGRAIRDTQEATLNQQGQLLNQGFQQQVQNMQQGQQNQNAAAQTLGQLAQTGQQLGLQGAAAQEAAGSAQQQQGQKNLDVANQQFTDQRDYQKNQATWLSGILNGNAPPTNSTSTSTSQQPGASPLTQVVGAIGGLGSLIGSFFKEGGAVRYADGGEVQSSIGAMAPNAGGYPSEMEHDNAILANIQAEGEAAAAKPANARDQYDAQAIQRYMKAFGVPPGHVSPPGYRPGAGQDADTSPNHRAPAERYAGGGGIGSLRGALTDQDYQRMLENDPDQNRTLENDPSGAMTDQDYQYLENNYGPGENPNPYVMPVAPPQLRLDENGNYVIDDSTPRYQDGGDVNFPNGVQPSYDMGTSGQRFHEMYNADRTNSAFADAFANYGKSQLNESPDQKILRLVTEFGIPEDEATALVYGQQDQALKHARGGSISSLRCSA
jgi:hypothetical protein